MPKLKTYKVPFDLAATNLDAIKKAIESKAIVFDDLVLSSYGGDARYSVFHDSFEVTSVTDSTFEFTVQVQYFAGCADQNDVFDFDEVVDYTIEDNQIVFELDETVWHQE
ncbi:hypothetical protein PUG46_00280 [Erwiniaceae bacterium L1_55_4]|nr:hypothetical protein [Erwiniaceae bacterium L1_55_4]